MQLLFVATIYIICTFGQDVEIDASPATKFAFIPSWIIDDMAEIENARVGERFESAEFEIGNATWQIVSFPNGHSNHTEGSYMVFVALKQMPEHWKEITVRYTISASQIFTRFTRIATYDAPKGLGWFDRSLLLEDIVQQKLDKLEWIVDIQILRITSADNDDKLLYQYPLSYHNKQHFEWQVDGQLLEAMKNAPQGKVFEMPMTRKDDDMWTIRVIPNGNNNGFVDAFLQLFALPVNVYSISVQYTLSCLETGVVSDVYTTYFNYIDNYWSWQKEMMSLDTFKNLNDTATFAVDMEIFNYYGKDGYEVVTMAYILELKSKVKELESMIQAQKSDEMEDMKRMNAELKKDIKKMQQQMALLVGNLGKMGMMPMIPKMGMMPKMGMSGRMGMVMNVSQGLCF